MTTPSLMYIDVRVLPLRLFGLMMLKNQHPLNAQLLLLMEAIPLALFVAHGCG